MSFEITCPYCFKTMKDDEVLFRSEKINQGENDILPDEYDDLEDFQARYRGADKETILSDLREWEFFAETEDAEYEAFWKNFNGTTEYNPADEILRVKAYRRRILDPQNTYHQKFLVKQPDGSYFIRDEQGMVTQIELNTQTHERCNRRVCRHCHNPFPDNYGKNKVKFATVIGITGAGKTIYLSQLLRKMRTYSVKVGLNAIVNNPGVRTFLESNSIVANKPLPGSTPATRFQQPLFYEMVRDARGHGRITETFVLYDVAGEVFKDAALVNKFAPFIEHADGVIVLIDPMQFGVVSGAAANGVALDEPTTVLETIHSIVSHGRSDEKCDIPFAVCMSKVDTEDVQRVLDPDLRSMLLDDVQGDQDSNGFNKPVFNARAYNPIAKKLNEFIQGNELVLAQQMRTNYSTYNFFAFTALGCDVKEGEENGNKYRYPVGPVLPKRVEEPVLWLFNKLGYIGENEAIFNPAKKIIHCPECGSVNTYELPPTEQTITVGSFFKRRKVHVNRGCMDCQLKWEYVSE